MKPQLSNPVAVLRSFDEAEARDFYIRYLGYSVLFEHRFETDFPLYMGIQRDGCVLHISEHHGDATPGSAVRIHVADLAGFHAELSERGHARIRPGIVDQSWGDREMILTDPFGNRLVFWQNIPQ